MPVRCYLAAGVMSVGFGPVLSVWLGAAAWWRPPSYSIQAKAHAHRISVTGARNRSAHPRHNYDLTYGWNAILWKELPVRHEKRDPKAM